MNFLGLNQVLDALNYVKRPKLRLKGGQKYETVNFEVNFALQVL